MKQLYDALVGEKNLYYYQMKFDKLDKEERDDPGTHPSWNWPAFLVPGAWALYRKMYGWFSILFGISLFFNFIDVAAQNQMASVVVLIAFLVTQIMFGMFANSLYKKELTKKIAIAKTTIPEDGLVGHLKFKGGVNEWVPWFLGVMVIFLFLSQMI